MRILGVCNLFPPYVLGGNELRLREVLEALRSRHEVKVLTSRPPPDLQVPEEEWIIRELVQIVPYPRPLPRRRFNLGRELAISLSNRTITSQVIAEHRPDVVYMSDTKRTFLGPAHAARAAGVPLVWDITDLSLLAYRRREAIRRHLPCMHLGGLSFRHPIAVSRFIRDALIDGGVLNPALKRGSSGILRQGVDVTRFCVAAPEIREGPARRLLFVGALIEDKGLHVVLRSLARLVQRDPTTDYRLTVCGDSGDEAYKARLRAYVEAQRLQERVDFRGRVPSSETPRLYREHDVLIFASIWAEPFATTPLEAMASGCPVIGTVVGGQRDFFRHGENCLTYDPEDPEELGERVRALTDSGLRRKLAEQAQAEVAASLSLETYVHAIEKVLLEATQPPNLQNMNSSRGLTAPSAT